MNELPYQTVNSVTENYHRPGESIKNFYIKCEVKIVDI